MTSPPDKEDPIYCEWKRCGGSGHRETQIRRIARYVVMADEARYLVCESCADFAVRELRQKGLLVEKHALGSSETVGRV